MTHPPYNQSIKLTTYTYKQKLQQSKTHCNCRREAEMHPCLLKVKARMRHDCWETYVHFLCMSNQACPGIPIVAIGKLGVSSDSGSYSTADTFSGDWIDAIQQRTTCQGCAFAPWAFFSVTLFLSYRPQSSPKLQKKPVFAKSNQLTEKLQYDRIHRHMDSILLSSFT